MAESPALREPDRPRGAPPLGPLRRLPDGRQVTPRLDDICPYLTTEGRAWRSATPVPEHRCSALEPPAPLASAKQRRLCLQAAHRTCATFLAAEGQLASLAGVETGPPTPPATVPRRAIEGRWRFTTTTPLVVERAPSFLPVVAGLGPGQIGLVVLALVAFGAIVLARSPSSADQTGSSEPTPTPIASSQVSPSAPASPSPASPSVEPSAEPSAGPSASPALSPSPTPAASFRTYRVRAGDTLSTIAARFGTTVKALADLNGIADPSLIRVGQLLLIP